MKSLTLLSDGVRCDPRLRGTKKHMKLQKQRQTNTGSAPRTSGITCSFCRDLEAFVNIFVVLLARVIDESRIDVSSNLPELPDLNSVMIER